MGIRSKVTWGITGLFGLAVVPVVNDFATKWAEEQEITTDPSKKVSWVMDHLSPYIHSWWFAVAFGALGGAMVALWLSRLWIKPPSVNPRATGDLSKLQKIYKGSYKNETIELDGKEFIDCTFERVTFHYMGGDFQIGPSTFIGAIGVSSDDIAIEGAIKLVAMANLARVETDGRGVTRYTSVLAFSEDQGATIQVPLTQSESPAPQSLPNIGPKKSQ